MESIDLIIESFNLDPMKEFVDIDPYDYFSENRDEEINQIYTEAKNTTKRNIFEKLISIFKKAWAFICKYFGKFVNWIKSLFTKKKKSADQIALKVLGSAGALAVGGAVAAVAVDAANDTPKNKISPKVLGGGAAALAAAGGAAALAANKTNNSVSSISKVISSQKISIPSSDKSTVQMNDIDVIFKPFMMEFDAAKNSVKINYSNLRNGMYNLTSDKDTVNQGVVVGQPVVERGLMVEDWDLVFLLIKNPETFQKLIAIINIIRTNEFSSAEFLKSIDNFNIDMNYKIPQLRSIRADGFEVSLDDIMKFQTSINNINTIITNFDQPTIDAMKADNPSNQTINALNDLVIYIARIQMGINAVTSVITNSFIVDMRFYQTVNDINKLSEFVYECVNNGIPAKYISYNCYILSDPSIKGNGSEGNKDNPIWGQSRVVFFPPNKNVVHKIALSQWGVRANKSEVSISKKFKLLGNSNALAMITNETKNSCIIDAEKVDTNASIPIDTAARFIDDIKSFCTTNNIPLDLTFDVSMYGHNLGIKNGKPVIIDYGIANRTSIGKAG